MSDIHDEAVAAGEAALAAYFEGDYEPGVIEEAGRESEAPINAEGDRPRDESGRFVSTKDEALFPGDSAEEPVPADVGTEPEEESAENEGAPPLEDETDAPEIENVLELELDDPELIELIESKYGGDVLEALKGLKESQSFIGQQSQEIGELRQLRQDFEAMQQQLQAQQYSQSVDWDEAIENDAEQAAMTAFEVGDMGAFGRAIDAVALESPFKASVMMQAFSQLANGPAPQQESQATSLETEVQALQARIPDLQQTLPAIQEELKSRPALQQALESGDPRIMTDALETAYALAKSRTVTSDTSKARTKLILKARAEADAAIADAAVVGASTVPQEAPPKNANEGLESLLSDIFGEHVPVV